MVILVIYSGNTVNIGVKINMKKNQRVYTAIALMIVTLIPLVPNYTMTDSWYEDNYQWPLLSFSTTKWLAYEAVQLATDPYEYQWLTSLWGGYLEAFFAGIASPRDKWSATGYASTDDYGDIGLYRLYLDDVGVVVLENNLSVRAQVEYEKLVNELNQTDPNEVLCAFYAGTTAHYVSQAGVWGAIVDNTTSLGNIIDLAETWGNFETVIEAGIATNEVIDPTAWWTTDEWYNSYFTLSPSVIAPANASEATIQLAKNIHPLAYDLGHNITKYDNVIANWTTDYKVDVQACLEYSVEAIFSVLQNALAEVNWKYITIPTTTIDYENITNHFSVDNFQVNFTDSIGSHILNDSTATEASFRFAYFPIDEGTPSLGTDVYDLSYDGGTDTWYFDEVLINGTAAFTEHRVYYTFNMNGTTRTWSLGGESFIADFLYIDFTSYNYLYTKSTWTLDIWNITAQLLNVPEIDFIEPYEVDTAEWILYQKGVGAIQPGTEPIGVAGLDTENRVIAGNLEYDNDTQTWYDNDTDIGWFHTPETFDNYVVVRFRISRLPIGYLKYNQLNQSTFVSWAQQTSTYYFRTRFHNITISAPSITFDPETLTIDIFNITAKTDYTNATFDGTLDWFEIHEKVVPAIMDDTRQATVKIYLFDGIASNAPSLGLTDLSWDSFNRWWYYSDIDVSDLPDNTYFAAAVIKNLNVNVTVESRGLASELFRIVRPIPVVYYILPEIFIIGFVALFGWLAWWRPRKKRIALEKEREEKLDKGFMD